MYTSTFASLTENDTGNILVNFGFPTRTDLVNFNGQLQFTLSGSATPGTDYNIIGASESDGVWTVTAAKPSLFAFWYFTFRLINDSIKEGDEDIIVTLLPGTGYRVDESRKQSRWIILDDDSDTDPPQVTSIVRKTPSFSPTNADQLTWRVTFNEVVHDVGATDFTLSGTTAGIAVRKVSGRVYDITASGGDLATLDGKVTLAFKPGQPPAAAIKDVFGKILVVPLSPAPTINQNSYDVDNTSSPTVELVAKTASIQEGTSTSTGDPSCGPVGDTAVEFDLTVSSLLSGIQDVGIERSSESAAQAQDYRLGQCIDGEWYGFGSSRIYSFAVTQKVTRLRLTATPDGDDEPDETVILKVLPNSDCSGCTAYTAGSGTVSITIQDDDDPPPPPDTTAPRVSSITRQTPSTSPTAADTLTWRVTFDEAVRNVDAADFAVTGTTATITGVSQVSGTNAYDVTASGGNLAGLNATVTLTFANGQNIQDTSGNALANTAPTGSNDNTYVVENTTPAGVTVSETTLSISEGGATGSYTVVLDSAPTADVTVTATSPDADAVQVHKTGGTAGASTTLTFTTSDWSQAQTVTVTAQDDSDSNDETVTITHTVSNTGGYGGVTAGSVEVSVDDDESANRLPTVANDIPDRSATAGTAFTYQFPANTFNDADGDTLTYTAAQADGTTLPSWLTFTPNTRTFSGTPAASDAGTVTVRVTANDGNGGTASDDLVITVSTTDPPETPTLSFSGDRYSTDEGEAVSITVNLRPARTVPTIVQLAYAEGGPAAATGGVDYTASPESIEIAANATSHTFTVQTTADEVAEPGESFTVTLSAPAGVEEGDIPTATVTIVDDDGVGEVTIATAPPPPPVKPAVSEALLVRFGRTVAEQALDGIAGRMAAPRTPGAQGAIAGQAISFDPAANDNAAPSHTADGSPADGTGSLALSDVARGFGANDASLGPDRFGTPGFGNGHGLGRSRTMTAREALLGSSFTATGETDAAGGSLAFWGRAAQSRFDGREGTFSLDGEVTAAMLGADYARGRWMVGLALMQSSGQGGYADGAEREGDGGIESTLTAAVPYATIRASERLKLWGAAGYGTGEVTLKTMEESYKADTTWTMAAAGARGGLLEAPKEGGGPALALTSDALWARTSSEKTLDLAASESDVTRLRLGLEGSYRMPLESGGSLVPKLEVGARHDGGDAETGAGIDLGGGIAWNDPALGLSLDVEGRTLIAHGNDDLKDRGYAASLAFDPDPATRRGPSLSLRQDFGGQATGGLDALFQPATLEDRTGSGEATSRWNMEAAYGFPAFGGRFTGSPHAGLGLATAARDYSLGWRLTPAANANAPDISFGLKATRRESDAQAAEQTVGFEINARW